MEDKKSNCNVTINPSNNCFLCLNKLKSNKSYKKPEISFGSSYNPNQTNNKFRKTYDNAFPIQGLICYLKIDPNKFISLLGNTSSSSTSTSKSYIISVRLCKKCEPLFKIFLKYYNDNLSTSNELLTQMRLQSTLQLIKERLTQKPKAQYSSFVVENSHRQRKINCNEGLALSANNKLIMVDQLRNEIIKKCIRMTQKFQPTVNLTKLKFEAQFSQHPAKEKRFRCNMCSKSCDSKDGFRRHVKIHHGHTESSKCAICHKVFPYQSVLEEHIRTHTGERPFLCRICRKDFVRGNELKIHMRTKHSIGQIPFKCETCQKRFHFKYALRQHVATHSRQGARSTCPLCPRIFRKRGDLANHLKWHSGANSCRCDTCGCDCATREGLKLHKANYCKVLNNTITDKMAVSQVSERMKEIALKNLNLKQR